MKFFRYLKDNWDNLKYITKHKYNIVGPGRDLELPWGQLLKHDLSKFTPAEWGPYRDFFFGPKGIKREPEGPIPEVKKKFKEAVKHHYRLNKHHHENRAQKYELESIADQYSAAKTQSSSKDFPDFKTWYKESKSDHELDKIIRNKLGLNKEASIKAYLLFNKLQG